MTYDPNKPLEADDVKEALESGVPLYRIVGGDETRQRVLPHGPRDPRWPRSHSGVPYAFPCLADEVANWEFLDEIAPGLRDLISGED